MKTEIQEKSEIKHVLQRSSLDIYFDINVRK